MKDQKIAVVGLGYVGLPVAVAFGEKSEVIGFDISEERVQELKQGIDRTDEVTEKDLENTSIQFTSDPSDLKEASFIIVAVPTPITENKHPDLTPLEKASKTIGANLSKGAIVIYESTVFPGATEEICIPKLEENSGMKNGKDFYVGYSPERINPGDKERTFKNITKVVSAQNEEVLDIVAEVYGSVIDADIYKASSIKVAEAAKVIENTQRDLNIALMNELAVIFEKLDIDTAEVLEAAGTKWNFLNFTPGLVGGHCIGVDPYYLTHKAQQVGHHPEIILAGRKTNDHVGRFIATSLVKEMIKQDMKVQGATVTILGFTFKENVPDTRNTRVIDVVNELEEYGVKVQVSDIYADPKKTKKEYGINLIPQSELQEANAVVFAVPHQAYLEKDWFLFYPLLKNKQGIVFDVKNTLDKENCPKTIKLRRL